MVFTGAGGGGAHGGEGGGGGKSSRLLEKIRSSGGGGRGNWPSWSSKSNRMVHRYYDLNIPRTLPRQFIIGRQ